MNTTIEQIERSKKVIIPAAVATSLAPRPILPEYGKSSIAKSQIEPHSSSSNTIRLKAQNDATLTYQAIESLAEQEMLMKQYYSLLKRLMNQSSKEMEESSEEETKNFLEAQNCKSAEEANAVYKTAATYASSAAFIAVGAYFVSQGAIAAGSTMLLSGLSGLFDGYFKDKINKITIEDQHSGKLAKNTYLAAQIALFGAGAIGWRIAASQIAAQFPLAKLAEGSLVIMKTAFNLQDSRAESKTHRAQAKLALSSDRAERTKSSFDAKCRDLKAQHTGKIEATRAIKELVDIHDACQQATIRV